jgi:hypothetical protein
MQEHRYVSLIMNLYNNKYISYNNNNKYISYNNKYISYIASAWGTHDPGLNPARVKKLGKKIAMLMHM